MSTPVVIICLLVICVFVIYKFFMSSKIEEKENIVESKESIEIDFLPLPKAISRMSNDTVFSIVRKIHQVFVKFDYKYVKEDRLDEKEWHTWQISMLLKLYKNDKDYFIPHPKKIFHPSILELDMKSLESLVHTLLLKYRNHVNSTKTKDELCKDIIWTSREISVLFYFLSKYKKAK